MAAYAYNAINSLGVESLGEVHAPDPNSAREQLRVRGLLATRLQELPSAGEESARTAFKKIKPKSLQIFSRQFATMIEAGLNVVSALVILEQQTDDKYLAAIIRELRADVEGGMLLSQAMIRHPKVFNRLYVSMVEAGEAAGILDTVLDRVAYQIEKETKIKRRVKGAMIYPTMVLIFATLVLVGMLLFLVPVFVNIFAQLGGDLPTLTKAVLACSNFIKSTWFILFPDAIAGVRQKVGEGVPIAQPLIENPVFPAMVSQMVKIGEETGELEKMLSKIADFYEDEVDASIQSLTSIVEPIMMLGVGIMVGVVIISMYLPMFKLLTLIKSQPATRLRAAGRPRPPAGLRSTRRRAGRRCDTRRLPARRSRSWPACSAPRGRCSSAGRAARAHAAGTASRRPPQSLAGPFSRWS